MDQISDIRERNSIFVKSFQISSTEAGTGTDVENGNFKMLSNHLTHSIENVENVANAETISQKSKVSSKS